MFETIFILIFVFIFGIVIGSFLNMLIYRLPLQIPLLKKQRSFCPKCENIIKWHENIPIISYAFLKGKCSHCKEDISLTYPIIELLGGFLFLFLFLEFGFTTQFAIYSVLFCILFVLSFIDLKYKAVPDYLLLVALVVALFLPSFNIQDALIFAGGFVLLDFLVTFYIQNIKARLTQNDDFLNQKALGEGDIPIVAVIGGVLGVQFGLIAIILASLFAIIPALYGHFKHKDIETPFIPFLALGLLLMVLFGENIYLIFSNLG